MSELQKPIRALPLNLLPRKHHETFEGKTQLLKEMPILGRMHILEAIPNSLKADAHAGEYEIHYVIDGSLGFWVGERTYDVRAGMAFITQPGELHGGVDATLQPAEWYWLRFRFPNADQALPELSLKSTRKLKRDLASLTAPLFTGSIHLRNCFTRLMEEHRQPTEDTPLMARLLFHELLLTVIRDHAKSRGTSSSSEFVSAPIQHVMLWIQEHLTEPLPCIDEIAAIAGLSESHFRRRFHEETGFSPVEYVTHQRIQRAKELLRSDSCSITALAFNLGFQTSAYFTQVFRKLTGMTPSEYKTKSTKSTSAPEVEHTH